MAGTAHRLPRTIWPVEYRVDLRTDPRAENFRGSVEMDLDVRAASDVVEMHVKDLQLGEASIKEGDAWRSLLVEVDADQETVRFKSDAPLAEGEATLRVSFEGVPNPGMHGLYVADDGQQKAIATQCEATDARAIFPCFDEPEFKAKIGWTIRTRAGLVALTNGPALGEPETDGDDLVWRFKSTEKVSSYLAALTIGEFESTPETVVRNTPIRVWAPRGRAQHGEFAHAITENFIPWFEDYFAMPYGYDKYDQVGVPGFDAGAMENVGLVLFRQSLLLMDPRAASWNQEKLIAKVVAHELAHMWFGNLVTMKWWDDLWLNEAFAEWFAHKAVHALAPDYLVWNDFQSDKNRALVDDALVTTHAIYTPVDTPDQAIEMFDVITYQKGCAVMRMLENFLGNDAFRDGIRSYMVEFAESNAAGDDLWRHLEQSSSQPVGKLMRSWIEQAGFPLVSVHLEGNTLQLTQERFHADLSCKTSEQHWTVPMVVRYADDEGTKEHRFLFSEGTHKESLPAQGAVKWCYANAFEIGFYRLRNDAALTQQLLAAIDELSVVERMGLIEDQWALLRRGDGDIVPFLDVLAKTAQSTDHNVARAVVDRLSTIEDLLDRSGESDTQEKLRGLVREWFAPTLKRLGPGAIEGDSQNDLQLRALALFAMAGLGEDPATVKTCQELADKERLDPRSVDANLAGTYLAVETP